MEMDAMKKSLQVAVTGIGVLCPLGDSPEQIVEALVGGRGAIDTIRSFPVENLSIKHAAEIHHFDPLQHFSEPEAARLDRTAQLGIVAARRAIQDAGLTGPDVASTRLGVVIGICAVAKAIHRTLATIPSKFGSTTFLKQAIYTQSDASSRLWERTVQAIVFRPLVHPVALPLGLPLNGFKPEDVIACW